jgi:hypothetical protein
VGKLEVAFESENAKELKEKLLTQIPKEMTLEFVRQFWSHPHDEAGVIDQVEQYMQSGKGRILCTFSSPEGGIINQ